MRAVTGYAAAAAATLIWSGNFIVARWLAPVMDPVPLALLRWGVAVLALAPLAWRGAWRERAALRAHLGLVAAAGLFGITCCNTLIYIAGRSTTAANMTLISAASPMFMLLMSRVLLGEALTRRRLLGLAAAVAGVAVLVSGGNPARLAGLAVNRGDLWMLAAAFTFAGYSVLAGRRPAGVGQVSFLFAVICAGFLFLCLWAALDPGAVAASAARMTPASLAAIVYVGLGASVAAFFLWNIAVTAIGPTRAGFVYYTLPVLGAVEGSLLLGEPVGWTHLASGALILGGIVLATTERVRKGR
jgi:drug/metabolite transporter (DMT)-like permease